MPETFLILLTGGIMLSAAVSDPREVILRWLRLAGILALCGAGLAMYFALRRDLLPTITLILLILTIVAILGQLAFVQIAKRGAQRAFAAIAVACAIAAGFFLLDQILTPRAQQSIRPPLGIACVLASATMGLSLMDMLLGHAYLNAAQMTMKPFLRLNRALALSMLARALLSIVATFVLQHLHPLEMFWNLFGLYIGTRWLVGFIVAGTFVGMAHDCIKRRSTQSATGILYVAGVLIFIGEIIGLYLMSETGIPL
jgi:hypothetical protein